MTTSSKHDSKDYADAERADLSPERQRALAALAPWGIKTALGKNSGFTDHEAHVRFVSVPVDCDPKDRESRVSPFYHFCQRKDIAPAAQKELIRAVQKDSKSPIHGAWEVLAAMAINCTNLDREARSLLAHDKHFLVRTRFMQNKSVPQGMKVACAINEVLNIRNEEVIEAAIANIDFTVKSSPGDDFNLGTLAGHLAMNKSADVRKAFIRNPTAPMEKLEEIVASDWMDKSVRTLAEKTLRERSAPEFKSVTESQGGDAGVKHKL